MNKQYCFSQFVILLCTGKLPIIVVVIIIVVVVVIVVVGEGLSYS